MNIRKKVRKESSEYSRENLWKKGDMGGTSVTSLLRLRQALGLVDGCMVMTSEGKAKIKSLNPNGTIDVEHKDGTIIYGVEPRPYMVGL